MRELLHIRQTSDVLEYSEHFQLAMHKVLVHNKSYDDVFFVNRFVDGLKHDIKSAIMLHEPRTVDVALSLALMQEEMLEFNGKRHLSRNGRDDKPSFKSSFTSTKGILGNPLASTEDKKDDKKEVNTKWGNSKLEQLKTLRKSKGLCMRCGEKYVYPHTCPKTISLHVVEELWELLHMEDSSDNGSEPEGSSGEEEIHTLSLCAAAGTQSKETMRLTGLYGNHEILILIDSGSSGNFVSKKLVSKLQFQTSH